MANITFEVEVDGEGNAKILHPEGPMKARNAAKAGTFTEKLARLLGRIKERHIGHHHHHDHNVVEQKE